jgi:hypothetical protein
MGRTFTTVLPSGLVVVAKCKDEKLRTSLILFKAMGDMIMMNQNLLLSNNQPSNVGISIHAVSNTKSNML